MIILADSGSTRTQWCCIDKERCKSLTSTTGINPYFLSKEEIITSVRPVIAGLNLEKIDAIYFFGAGCGNSSKKAKLFTALQSIFKTKNIFVDSDLIAACLALFGKEQGIVSILGTGSNSCVWDGKKIKEQTPSLGFILGDEGGAVSMGKQLVSDFLKNQMPNDLRILFSEQYDISTEIVLERVYQMQMPNRYLAGFAPFLNKNIHHPYVIELISEQFHRFIRRNILPYGLGAKYPIRFTGSIAWHFQDFLKPICQKYELNADKFVKEPINELQVFFQKHIVN